MARSTSSRSARLSADFFFKKNGSGQVMTTAINILIAHAPVRLKFFLKNAAVAATYQWKELHLSNVLGQWLGHINGKK